MRPSLSGLATACAVLVVLTSCLQERPAPTPSPTRARDQCAARRAAGSPLPTSPAPTGVVAPGIGPLPREYRYLSRLGPGADQVLLADLDRGVVREAVTVPHPRRPGLSGVSAYANAASADGQTVVVLRRPDREGGDFFVVRPVTGQVELAYETGASVSPPIVAPDGASFAFLEAGDIKVVSLAERTIRRVFAAENASIGPLSWSGDGRWLAVAVGLAGPRTSVAVVDTCGPEARFDTPTRAIVSGSAIVTFDVFHGDLSRDGRPFLLWDTVPRSPSVILQLDAATGATRTLYRPGAGIGLRLASWHPAKEELLTVEYVFGPGNTGNSIWRRTAGGGGTQVRPASQVSDAWWSRDGSRIFALAFESGSGDMRVIDASTSATVATLCSLDPCP